MDSIFIQATELDPLAIRREAIRKINILNTSESVIDIIEPALPYTIDLSPLPGPPTSGFGQFMAATLPFTPGATAQDVFTLYNAGQKTITVNAMGVSSVQGTAGSNTWNLLARTTPNTGGTSSLVGAVPLAAGYPDPTAEVRTYTANPTAGNLAGRLWAGRVPSPVVGTAGIGNANIELPLDRRGISLPPGLTLALNLNGVTPAGLSVMAWVAWSEN